jgi:serine/threonine protein kinase
MNPEFNAIHTIEVDDTYFDSGAFGEIYHCKSIDGRKISSRQVIKRFLDDGSGNAKRSYETICRLQDNLVNYNNALMQKNAKPLQEVKALGGLPQFSFEGTLNGVHVYGYSANYLQSPDWLLFGELFNEPDKDKRNRLLNEFYNLPLEHRIKMAYCLAEGFIHLEQLKYIYADLNAKNLFINQKDGEVCLIDYEGGAVNDNPETYGKAGEWLAPEIQLQLLMNNTPIIKVDLNTDTWAVAIAIHFMLFNFHPLFFLKLRGKSEMEAYFKQHKWPSAVQSDPNFRQEVGSTYQSYIHRLQTQLPGPLYEAFDETINKGYNNPNRRLSYRQWLRVLSGCISPVVITDFTADRLYIIAGIPVTLKWQVEKARAVYIDQGIGEVTSVNEIKLRPEKSIIYTLSAEGHGGPVSKPIYITVFPTPVIETLKVPIPDFNSTINMSSQTAFSQLNLSIDMDTEKLTSAPLSFVKLDQYPIKTGPLNNEGLFWSITKVFNMVKERIIKTI